MKQLSEYHSFCDIKTILFDFDGVMTNNMVILNLDGSESVQCSRYDGFGISRVVNLGLYVAVLTSERVPLAKKRCEKLHIPCFDGLNDKLEFATKLLSEQGLNLNDSCFIGNDINDLSLLESVSFPIVTCDSHPSVHKNHFYVTSVPGGFGCVREVCDLIADSHLSFL